MGSNGVDPLKAVCTAYSLRGTKRGPQIVLSDLEQGRSYGPLLTRGAETKRARSIEVQTQGVCSAYSLRGTKRRPESVHSDLEQRCSYGPLLTRATETELARLINTETQAGGVIMEFINNVHAAQGNGGNLGYIYMECTKNQGANVHQHMVAVNFGRVANWAPWKRYFVQHVNATATTIRR